jgi:uncharacterized protein (DUF58 family)
VSFVSRYLEPNLIERLNNLQLSARRVVEGATTGQHKGAMKGASVEFRQHRFYVPGDEPRRLDWRVLGRTDRPYIKEYDEETNLRCVILLDASGSMGYGSGKSEIRNPKSETRSETKFEYGSKIAAALAYLMLGQTESVGMGIVGKRLGQWLAPRPGTGQLTRIIETLERNSPRGPAGLGASIHDAAERLGRRALVIVISDCFAPAANIRKGLAHLRHDGHEVIVARVLHRDEMEFPFDTWCRMQGLEGERSQLCEPALMRKTYLDNFRRHARELDEACRALSVELTTFVTDKALIEALTQFLHRRMR